MSRAKELREAEDQREVEAWQCETCNEPREEQEGARYCRYCRTYWEDAALYDNDTWLQRAALDDGDYNA